MCKILKSMETILKRKEDKIMAPLLQQVSPLELSGIEEIGKVRQIGLGEEVKMLEVAGTYEKRSLIVEFFPDIEDGIKIRPQLSSDDLRLMKDGLVELMLVRGESGSASRYVQLLRRMLRRV